MELQAKKEREQKQLILFEKKKKNDTLRLAGPSQQRIILESDNCWFNVKIALGDCANDAIDCLEGISKNLYDKLRERDQEGQLQLANLAGAALQEATTVATATAVKFVDVLWYGAKQLDVAVLNGVEYARDAIEESLSEKHFKKK
mmetsp:Transcript_40998/g.57666  ORF Transcript_40998/g.57666 Transcript_40998/m.57666 type:complete len:145 (-) Transcript_40998:113-547(-)